ncbi:MAG: hypothetical protein AB1730_08030 [Myxococcota bacterium]
MPVERNTDDAGRVHLRLRPKQSLLVRVLGGVVTFGVLFLFGPGLLGLGTMRCQVSCTREAGAVRCVVREGVLFGLFSTERRADDVREAVLIGKENGGSTRIALVTASGEVPVLSVASDRNAKDKEALASALRMFLADPAAPRLEAQQDFVNLFAPLGGLCSIGWLLVLASVLSLPRYALRPQVLVVDPGARTLALREKPGSAKVVTVPLREVEAVSVTLDSGGWIGSLVAAGNTAEAAGAKPARGAAAPPLHVALKLKSGERLVLQNGVRLPDDEVRALAAEVAKLLNAPLTPEPRPAAS